MIVVDHRECRSGICEALAAQHAAYVVRTLTVGDYLVNGDVLVERKTTGDFLESIASTRLFDQVARVRARNSRALLIIEGARLPAYPRVRAILLSLAVQWHLPVIRTRHVCETAWALAHIDALRERHAPSGHAYDYRAKRQTARLDERMLRLIPSVGEELAAALLHKFGSLGGVITASKEELMTVAGIGEVLATRISALNGARTVRAADSTHLQIHSLNEFTPEQSEVV